MKRLNKIISSVVLVCFLINTTVSDFAYALGPGVVSGELRPNGGDDTLFVRNIDSEKSHKIKYAINPTFSENSKWVSYVVEPNEAEEKKLKKSKKTIL